MNDKIMKKKKKKKKKKKRAGTEKEEEERKKYMENLQHPVVLGVHPSRH